MMHHPLDFRWVFDPMNSFLFLTIFQIYLHAKFKTAEIFEYNAGIDDCEKKPGFSDVQITSSYINGFGFKMFG